MMLSKTVVVPAPTPKCSSYNTLVTTNGLPFVEVGVINIKKMVHPLFFSLLLVTGGYQMPGSG